MTHEWSDYEIKEKKFGLMEGYAGQLWILSDLITQIGTYRISCSVHHPSSHGLSFEPRKGDQMPEILWVKSFKPNKKPLSDFIKNAKLKAMQHFDKEIM